MRDEERRRFGGKIYLIHLLYDVAFLTVLLLGSPYIIYRIITSQRFRAGLLQRMGFVPKRPGKGKAIWIHGVSVGETKTSLPLVQRIERAYPEMEWAISTTTQAGHQIAKKLFPGKFIFYFPMDIGFIVKRVMRRINPGLIILMELEIWPNMLYQADRWGADVVIVNGRISERSYWGYRKLNKLFGEMARIKLLSVQNTEYRDRLIALDILPSRIVVTGNIKYDGIDTSPVTDGEAIREELRLSASSRILVAGSTHPGEEEILLDRYVALRRLHDNLRLVMAPRHLERVDDIEKMCAKRGFGSVRRTTLPPGGKVLDGGTIMILDTIGELDRIYGAADIVFVGGSLVPLGGHNMMEPAGKGKPVLYGPHVMNFAEDAALLERCNAAVRLKDEHELETWIDRLLRDDEEARRLGEAARETIAKAKGATERNFELLDRYFLKDFLQKRR